MIIYITEMLRWGDDESHHYIVGAFETKEEAVNCGEAHKTWRGGKYEYRVDKIEVGYQDRDVLDYHNGCAP